MSEKHTCCERIFTGYMGSHVCGKGAAYEHDGQWFCKTHHPPTVREKRDAKQAIWRAEWEAKRAQEKAVSDAAAEQKRKADAYDQLAERNAELLEVLQSAVDCGMVPKSSAAEGGASRHSEQARVADQIRAALAKCQPKEATP